jgi:hypothetical protein
MSFARKTLVRLALVALPFVPLGCGSKTADDPKTLTQRNELVEIHDMYTLYAKRNGRPPQKAADLTKKVDQSHSAGYRALKNNDYVVIWGVDVKAGSGTVLAYEKDAPKQGGMVLMADGSVKTLSADELQTALKGKG